MAKKKIDYTTMTVEQLEAAEIAAREQCHSSLAIVGDADLLPSLEDITEENLEDGEYTGDLYLAGADELPGQAIDLKQDFETWSKIVDALFAAKYPARTEDERVVEALESERRIERKAASDAIVIAAIKARYPDGGRTPLWFELAAHQCVTKAIEAVMMATDAEAGTEAYHQAYMPAFEKAFAAALAEAVARELAKRGDREASSGG
jgi:hypothetical protein